MEEIDTDYTTDELEKLRLNFSKCANRDIAPLIHPVKLQSFLSSFCFSKVIGPS